MIAGPPLVVTIGRMTEDDIPAVREIERQSFPTVWRAEAYSSELRNPSGCYLVARWQERVIGFAGQWLIREQAHVATLAVDPPHRRRGVGRRLLIALLREAIQRGATRMTLEVRESNEAAQRLYQGFGFETVARIGRYYADTGEDAVVMWLHGIHKRAFRAKLAEMEEQTAPTAQ